MTMVSFSAGGRGTSTASYAPKQTGSNAAATDLISFDARIGGSGKHLPVCKEQALEVGEASSIEGISRIFNSQAASAAADISSDFANDASAISSSSTPWTDPPSPATEIVSVQPPASQVHPSPIGADGGIPSGSMSALCIRYATLDFASERNCERLTTMEEPTVSMELPRQLRIPNSSSAWTSSTQAQGAQFKLLSKETHLIAASSRSMMPDPTLPGTDAELSTVPIAPREALAHGADAGSNVEFSSKDNSAPLLAQITERVVSGASAPAQGGSLGETSSIRTTLSEPPHGPWLENEPGVVKSLRFGLNPGNLGEVHARLVLKQNELRLHLSFSSENAAFLARADEHVLMQAIADGGLVLSQLSIDAGQTLSLDASLSAGESKTGTSGGAASGNSSGHQSAGKSAQHRRMPARAEAGEEPPRNGVFI